VDLQTKIEQFLAEPFAEKGYEIVRIYLSSGFKPILQIMIDRLDGSPINVDDCATASRLASFYLDHHDPIKGNYMLEVSSTGIEKPLVKPRHFERQIGKEVKVNTHLPVEGRRKFQGVLTNAQEEGITLTFEENHETKTLHLKYEDIKSARLFVDFNKL
jgi:ribosome maturation factor RimP